MKNKINSNSKPKSVIIDGGLHYKFKIFCKGKGLKIGAVLEDLIRLYLTCPKQIRSMIDKHKEEEIENYA